MAPGQGKGGAQGGFFAERFKNPSCGGSRRLAAGGNPPAPAFTRRGKRDKGAIQIPCAQAQFAYDPSTGLPSWLPQTTQYSTQKPEFLN